MSTATKSPESTRFNSYPQVEAAAQVRAKPFNEELRARLEQYQNDNELSNGDLGKKLGGVHATAVSKYINGKPEGDVARLESIAADVLKNAETIRRLDKQPEETSVSRAIEATVNTARKTNDFALITGPAGIGKSAGVTLYLKNNPVAMVVTAATWCRNGTQVARAMWEAVETSTWRGGGQSGARKIDFLIAKLKGSDRPLIVDNAHRLRSGAIEYLFDFHDETDIPVVLVGNPEIRVFLSRNDQQFSRIGLHKHIEKFDDLEKVALMIIRKVAPDFTCCAKLAIKVLAEKGKARALRKELSLAQELYSKESFRSDCEGSTDDQIKQIAFKAAHTRLIRNYTL